MLIQQHTQEFPRVEREILTICKQINMGLTPYLNGIGNVKSILLFWKSIWTKKKHFKEDRRLFRQLTKAEVAKFKKLGEVNIAKFAVCFSSLFVVSCCLF